MDLAFQILARLLRRDERKGVLAHSMAELVATFLLAGLGLFVLSLAVGFFGWSGYLSLAAALGPERAALATGVILLALAVLLFAIVWYAIRRSRRAQVSVADDLIDAALPALRTLTDAVRREAAAEAVPMALTGLAAGFVAGCLLLGSKPRR